MTLIFRLKKENISITDRIVRNIGNLFEYEGEEYYYKQSRVSNIWTNNYIKYESNGDKNRTLSVKKYLNKIRPYLKDINNFKKYAT